MTCHCSDSFKHVQYITYKHVTTKLVLIIFLNWIILQILLFYLLQINQKLLYQNNLEVPLTSHFVFYHFGYVTSLYSGKIFKMNLFY